MVDTPTVRDTVGAGQVVPPPETPSALEASPPPSLLQCTRGRARRIAGMARRYPVPFVALALMLLSGVLWLSGQRQAAEWALAAVTVIGGLPLVWATLRQVLAREFGIDLIALLAITGSFLLADTPLGPRPSGFSGYVGGKPLR
jgi:cation transport ATPase